MQQVRSYGQIQNNESKLIATFLLDEPKNYVMHFERYAASIVSIIAYGRRIPSCLDPIITEVIAVMHDATGLNIPGKSFPMLMETFPILAKFPNPDGLMEKKFRWPSRRKGLLIRFGNGGE